MSDVPELDRLLEEAELVRRNVQWERTDRFMRRTLGCVVVCALLTIPLGVIFGRTGVAVGVVAVLMTTAPILAAAVYMIIRECFNDPPRKDPTKRYKYQ